MTLLQELDYVRNFVRKQMETLGKNIEDPKAYRDYAEAKKSLDILASNEEIWKAGVQAMADKIDKETPLVHSEIATKLTRDEVDEFSLYKSHLSLLEQRDDLKMHVFHHSQQKEFWYKMYQQEVQDSRLWLLKYLVLRKKSRLEIQAAKHLNV